MSGNNLLEDCDGQEKKMSLEHLVMSESGELKCSEHGQDKCKISISNQLHNNWLKQRSPVNAKTMAESWILIASLCNFRVLTH